MHSVWRRTAAALGWRWSQAHGGFINEAHRRGAEWSDYEVAETAEHACFLDGLETEAEARAYLADKPQDWGSE